jgi:phosphoribosylformylglycinamidine synthase
MLEPKITPELIKSHGLNNSEYDLLLKIIDREPTFTELGIFSAMWNEHCSYKSSKKWLRLLPTKGKNVICGPGENAGIVDIGDNQAVVLKWKATTTQAILNRIRVLQPVWEVYLETSLQWARDPWQP